MRKAWVCCAVVCSACLNATPPSIAPTAIDANLKWFFSDGASADDAALRDGIEKLAAVSKAETRVKALKGQMPSRLEKVDLKSVGLDEANEPANARGLLVLNLFDCTLERLEQILIAQDQKGQYEGVYDSYTRTYTSDEAAYRQGAANALTWNVEVKASLPIDDAYTSQLKGGIRRGASSAVTGPFLMTRTWLLAPAQFSGSSSSYFKQDYQIELFWEQSPGHIFHAYGMWREIKDGGFNLTLEDDGFMNLVLDNLVKWDETTAKLCQK